MNRLSVSSKVYTTVIWKLGRGATSREFLDFNNYEQSYKSSTLSPAGKCSVNPKHVNMAVTTWLSRLIYSDLKVEVIRKQ